jgi:hypothetical protein
VKLPRTSLFVLCASPHMTSNFRFCMLRTVCFRIDSSKRCEAANTPKFYQKHHTATGSVIFSYPLLKFFFVSLIIARVIVDLRHVKDTQMAWKSSFRQNYQTTFSPIVPSFAAGISRGVVDLEAPGGKSWNV